MSEPDEAQSWHPRYKLIQWSAALVLLLLLLGGFLVGRFAPPMGQLAFCAFGVFTGAAFARMSHPTDRELTRLGQIALIFVASSQIFFQMLVWSETWRVLSSAIGWRLWWISVVMAVGLGWLQVLWRAGARWEGKSGRTTLGCTGALGLLMVGQTFIAKPLATLPEWWVWTAIVLTLGMAGGSLVILGRWMRDRPKSTRPLPPWMKPALYTLGTVALCAGSFYIGRITSPSASPFDSMPMTLKSMLPEKVDKQIEEDLKILSIKASRLGPLLKEMDTLHKSIVKKMKAEGRGSYSQDENERIRNQYIEYLEHRDRLIRMATLYSAYKTRPQKQRRERAFLLGYCAAVTALDVGRVFVKRFLDDDLARAKFNEPGTGGREAGQFELVYESVTATRHMKMFAQYGMFYTAHREGWKNEPLFDPDSDALLTERIDLGIQNIDLQKLNPVRAWFERLAWRLKRDAYEPVYGATRLMATLVSDMRIVQREQFISVALAQQAVSEKNLKPGDIILTRRNWHLSNAFLPGFWPHAALYVGTPEQLEGLGINQKNAGVGWEAYMKKQHGHQRVILEAVGEGVRFHCAEYTLNADYVMVLRPRLGDEQKKAALLKAFDFHGRPYDFDFDFVDEHKIVCSELIYRAYSKMLEFDRDIVVGKEVYSPLGIAKKFKRELGSDKDQLEFILFLDKPPGESRARFATSAECCKSVDRPKAFNE